MVHAHTRIHTIMGTFSVHFYRRVIVAVNVQRGELPGEQVMGLPMRVASGCSQANEHPSLVKIQGLLQIERRGDHGGVHVIHVDIQQAEAGAPVSVPSVDKVRILWRVRERGGGEGGDLDEPRSETVGLEGGVRDGVLIEVGVVLDAHRVDPVCDVREPGGCGEGAGVVGGDVVEAPLTWPRLSEGRWRGGGGGRPAS
jgi:hypothetical protein